MKQNVILMTSTFLMLAMIGYTQTPPLPRDKEKTALSYKELLANIYNQIQFNCCIHDTCTVKIGCFIQDNGDITNIEIAEDNCWCQLGLQCLRIVQKISNDYKLIIDNKSNPQIIIPINFL